MNYKNIVCHECDNLVCQSCGKCQTIGCKNCSCKHITKKQIQEDLDSLDHYEPDERD